MDSTRKKEDEVKKSTAEQLEIFRRQREDAEKAEDATEINENSELWKAAPKKRKRKQEKGPFKGLKLRRKSSTAEDEEKSRTKDVMNLPEPDSRESTKSGPTPTASSEEVPNQLLTTTYTKADSPSAAPTPARPAATLGLDSYSSDEDY